MCKKKLFTILFSTTMLVSALTLSQSTASASGTSEWKHDGTGWKYQINGQDFKGWLSNNKQWYYFNTSGNMDTGWLLHNGKWYFFNTDGTMKTGWVLHNGKWYFLGNDGDMKTGWLKQNDKWYYLNEKGYMSENCWIYYNDKWYYLDSDGNMAINKTTPDGFELDENGVWTGRSDKTSIPSGVTSEAVSSSTINIQWNKVTDADYYYVYYSLNKDTGFKAIMEGTSKENFQWASAHSAVISNIAPETKVYFKITAVKDNNESKYSTSVSAITEAGSVAAPTGVAAEALSVNRIQVTWDAVIGADSYKVYYKESTASDYTVVQKTSSPMVLTGLEPGTKVYFKITAVKGSTASLDSTEVSVVTKNN